MGFRVEGMRAGLLSMGGDEQPEPEAEVGSLAGHEGAEGGGREVGGVRRKVHQ